MDDERREKNKQDYFEPLRRVKTADTCPQGRIMRRQIAETITHPNYVKQINTFDMNTYYFDDYNNAIPFNGVSDGFEAFNGRHIDDRMRSRGASYDTFRPAKSARHYVTMEDIEEKRRELSELESEMKELQSLNRERASGDILSGAELESEMSALEDLTRRISICRDYLINAVIMKDEDINTDIISFLSRVQLRSVRDNKACSFRIVGKADGDICNGRLSCESPLGKALMGKHIGETVVVNAPAGTIEYKVISISC